MKSKHYREILTEKYDSDMDYCLNKLVASKMLSNKYQSNAHFYWLMANKSLEDEFDGMSNINAWKIFFSFFHLCKIEKL